jgi:ABC-type amino acid transport substrate-binding protein
MRRVRVIGPVVSPVRRLFLAIAAAGLAIACMRSLPAGADSNAPPPSEGAAQSRKETFEGVLKSGYVGIGGEHTGWMLLPPAPAAGFEIDISKVVAQAKALDGKPVLVTGRLEDKTYIERGHVKILVAEILAAKPQ